MLDIIFKMHGHLSDRDLLYTILANQLSNDQKLEKIMSAATDLQALVDQLTASQAGLKTSLDTIKTGVATIVAGIPEGGMTADEVAALKAKITSALATEQANASEAADDAAAVTSAQPAAPVTTDPGSTDGTQQPAPDPAAAPQS